MAILETITNTVNNLFGINTQQKENNLNSDYDSTKILSDYESAQYNLSLYNPYNPDPLILRKTLNIYDDMFFKDEQIQALLTLKKSFIIGNGWLINTYQTENEKLDELKDFIYFCLDTNFKGIFNEALSGILTSFQFGFSVSEIVLQKITEGKFKGKIGLNRLITRPPHSFEFRLNPQGDIVNLQQNCLSVIKKDLPINKFLIYTNKGQFGNPYGVSDLRSIYGWYVFKDMLIKYAAIAGERNSMPYAVGKVPKNTSQSDRTKFKNILSKMQAKGVAVLDDDSKIELLESSKAGNQEYYKIMIELCNNHYSKAFLLPELLGFSSHEGGSQALGREQFDIFMNSVAYPEQQRLSDCINERIIKPLIDLNFGKQEEYPYFEFKKAEKDNSEQLLNSYILAVEKGIIKNTLEDENLIREKLGHPEREEDEQDVLEPIIEPIQEPMLDKDIEKPEDTIKEVKKEIADTNIIADDDFEDGDIAILRNGRLMKPKKEEMAEIKDDIKWRRPLTQFEENVSLNTIKSDIESQEKDMALGLFKVIDEIKTELENKVIKQKIVENKKFNLINDLMISESLMADLGNVFSQSLNSAYKVAKQVAKEDTIKRTEFAEKQYTIGAIESKQTIAYLNAKGISLTGTEQEFILKGVKNILTDGLKTGKTQSQVVSNLEDFFNQNYVAQLNSKGDEIDINSIGGRLETVIRTNLNDAYNQGRMALYNDPDIKGFVEALQYSAIIDDATTDFCAGMDGKIYPASDAIWDTITPPNHFNCRSILIPVFQGESYEVSDKIKEEPAKGFGGNE
jgi:SPP1 gp7 family putative phage head morphogenesis protein